MPKLDFIAVYIYTNNKVKLREKEVKYCVELVNWYSNAIQDNNLPLVPVIVIVSGLSIPTKTPQVNNCPPKHTSKEIMLSSFQSAISTYTTSALANSTYQVSAVITLSQKTFNLICVYIYPP